MGINLAKKLFNGNLTQYESNNTAAPQILKIFICHNPIHLYLARFIRDEKRQEHDCCILVDLDGIANGHDDCGWDAVISKQVYCPFVESRDFKTQCFKVINAKRLYRLIRQKMRLFPRTIVWYPTLRDFLPNHLFFRFRKSRKVEFNVIQDGLLNYYPYKELGTNSYFHFTKFLMGLLFGFIFIPYSGLSSGVDRKEVKGQYLMGAGDLSECPEKFRRIRIPPSPNSEASPSQNILVLGQEVHLKKAGLEKYEELSNDLLNFAQKMASPQSVLFYKPHHYDPTAGVFSRMAQARGFQLIETTGEIAEALAGEYRFARVISFTSSALFNLKIIYGDSLESWSVDFEKVLNGAGKSVHDIQKLRKLFASVGVKFAPEQQMVGLEGS